MVFCLSPNSFCNKTSKTWASLNPETWGTVSAKRMWVQVPVCFVPGSESQSELRGFITTHPHGFSPCLSNPSAPFSRLGGLASTETLRHLNGGPVAFTAALSMRVSSSMMDNEILERRAGFSASSSPLPHIQLGRVCVEWVGGLISFPNSTSLKALNYYIDFIGLSNIVIWAMKQTEIWVKTQNEMSKKYDINLYEEQNRP